MASRKKLPDIDESTGLGDLTEILHNQGVANLDWLSVDMDDYRALEALPKQNLDTIPELQDALAFDPKTDDVPSVIPLRPHATVNTNPLDTSPPPLRTTYPVVNRLASYVMSGMPDQQIAAKLSLEYSASQLRASSEEANRLIGEKGLLGNVYVDASHFPRCAQDGPHRKEVATHGKRALFVLAKEACSGCVCNKGGQCSSFKKRIVQEVPYTTEVAAHYATQLSREGRLSSDCAKALSSGNPAAVKDALRTSFLRHRVTASPDGVQTAWTQRKPERRQASEAEIREFLSREPASPPPSPTFLLAANRMTTGKIDPSSLANSSEPGVRALAAEHGILGHTYLDGDALGGPAATIAFINKSGRRPDFVLLRNASEKMKDSVYAARVAELSEMVGFARGIVSSVPELTEKHLVSACIRALNEGRMTEDQARSVSERIASGSFSLDPESIRHLVAQANLFQPPERVRKADVQTAVKAKYHTGTPRNIQAPISKDEVRSTVSHLMNTGLQGKRLQGAILSRYARGDLARFPELSRLAAEDGVQGSYFVDPTAYGDYGKGCSEGSNMFRRSSVPYVMVGSSCTGCRLQTHPGWCSKYAKEIIRQVPEAVRTQAAERRRLPLVPGDAPVENPVEKYELSSELEIEPAPSARPAPEISMGSKSVGD